MFFHFLDVAIVNAWHLYRMSGLEKKDLLHFPSISSSCTTECKFHQNTHKRKTQCHPTSGEAPSSVQATLWDPVWPWEPLAPAHRSQKRKQVPWCCMHPKNKVHLHAMSCGFVLWVLLQVLLFLSLSAKSNNETRLSWQSMGLSFHSHYIIIVEL